MHMRFHHTNNQLQRSMFRDILRSFSELIILRVRAVGIA